MAPASPTIWWTPRRIEQGVGELLPLLRGHGADPLAQHVVAELAHLRALSVGGAALLKQYNGADEEDKKIISEIFRRLAVDVKAELKKAAGQSLKTAEKSLADMKHAITGLCQSFAIHIKAVPPCFR